ncbi:hypothetical protein [Chitinophaga sp. GbtcB8]|uniref:hypothetical protein n=1 Tax=Chitinophaga sp. GbtcB8 TaxID=2824753 RepID=UPI001C2FCFA8|nr:hypothetical protein [Chitinophaga sp. GbtcB8]
MKKNRFTYIAALVAIVLLNACQQPQGPIPFDPQKASIHTIPINEAATLTRDFRNTRDQLIKNVRLDSSLKLPTAETFNRDAFAVLLNQKDAQGIRIYYGRGKNGEVRLVMVPVDSKGEDIVVKLLDGKNSRGEKAVGFIPGISTAQAQVDDAEAMENGQRCDPPPCKASKLTR